MRTSARTRRGVLGAVLALVVTVAGALAAGARGTVVEPKGTVEHFVAAFQKWRGPLRGQTPIEVGDRIRTGSGSSCIVLFTNAQGKQDSIAVAADTLLEVPDIPENEESVDWIGMFSEAVGKVFCAITRRPPSENEQSPFNVRSPNVVAGVRGTEFEMSYRRKEDTTLVRVVRGVVRAVRFIGTVVGLLSRNQDLAIDALRAAQIATHLQNLDTFFRGAKEVASAKYNLEFHVARASTGRVRVDGQVVDTTWGLKEIPWSGPGRTADNPVVVSVDSGGSAILHLRDTGWFLLEGDTELSCYRLGNAWLGRVRKGTVKFRRADPNFGAIEHSPSFEVEFFLRKPDGNDLRVLDYTPKGGVTQVSLEMASGGRMPTIDVAQGKVKVLHVQYE